MRINLYILLVLSIISCDSERHIESVEYSDIVKQSVESNSENIYFYSHPKDLNAGLPVIICIDAHGDGKAAVERIRKVLFYEEALIIGSNSIQNGSPLYDKTITELLAEAAVKFEAESKNAFLIGFSGGARMAHLYASNFPVKGVIMFGAGPGNTLPRTKTHVSTGISDFNFLETYMRPDINLLDESNYLVDYHQEGHVWPDSSTISDAVIFHFPNEVILNQRKKELISRSNEFALSGNGLEAFKCLEKAYKYEFDENEKKKIRANAKDLLETTVVKRDLATLENYLRQELQIRNTFIDHSRQVDDEFWKKEIDVLREKAKFSSNTNEIYQSNRLLSYMGILFYSQLKVLIYSGGKENTTSLIKAFEYLEPENPDMFYFKALMFSKNGQMDSAGHYIALARKHGLKE